MNNNIGIGVPTIGQALKVARESKSLSVAEVAQRLLLGKHLITALENDDYSRIPARVYAEGYLKAYAKLLHITAEPLLKQLRQMELYGQVPVTAQPEIPAETQTIEVRTSPFLLKRRSALLILGLVFAAVTLVNLFLGRKFSAKHSALPKTPKVMPTIVKGGDLTPHEVPIALAPTDIAKAAQVVISQELANSSSPLLTTKPVPEQ